MFFSLQNLFWSSFFQDAVVCVGCCLTYICPSPSIRMTFLEAESDVRMRAGGPGLPCAGSSEEGHNGCCVFLRAVSGMAWAKLS